MWAKPWNIESPLDHLLQEQSSEYDTADAIGPHLKTCEVLEASYVNFPGYFEQNSTARSCGAKPTGNRQFSTPWFKILPPANYHPLTWRKGTISFGCPFFFFAPRRMKKLQDLVLRVHITFFSLSRTIQMKHVSKIKRKIFPKHSKHPILQGNTVDTLAGSPSPVPGQSAGSGGGSSPFQ